MRYEKQFFNFAMASGIASAEMRFKNESEDVQDRAETLQKAVHLIVADWGLFPDYMKYATDITGINAEGYFDDYLAINAEEKVELTKEVLFETACTKGVYATALEFDEELKQRVGYDVALKYATAQVKIFDMFFEAMGMHEEYSDFLDKKIRDLLN